MCDWGGGQVAALAGSGRWLHTQDEVKLRQLQEACFAGQMPRADSEKGLTVGQLAVVRLGRLLGDRVAQYALASRRQALLYTASRLGLYPLQNAVVPARDSATRVTVMSRLAMCLGHP